MAPSTVHIANPSARTVPRRYDTLDAMRGLAAISVVFLHTAGLSSPINAPGAYKAVDLFFILSGFVIAHAYDARFARGMSPYRFIVLRLVRLYPLYFAGLMIGFVVAASALAFSNHHLSLSALTWSMVTGALMLPSPTWPQVYLIMPINFPAWSLFFEVFVNIVYAFSWRWLSRPVLAVVVVMAGLWLIWSAHALGTTDMGATWPTIGGGFARVCFSFPLGILLYRCTTHGHRTTVLAWLVPLVALLLLVIKTQTSVVSDLAFVLVLSPTIVLLGVCLEVKSTRLAAFLGTVSYAVYVLHLPVILLLDRAFSLFHHDPNEFAPWIGLVLAVLLLVLCWVIDKWYDTPIRVYLKKRLSL